MSDLIDRAEVMKLLDEQCWNGMFTYFRGEHHVNCFRELVKAIPSVENKGEWIKIKSGDKDFPESIVCSKCKNENSHLDFNEHGEPIGKVFVTSKFCPNCGADMRGE